MNESICFYNQVVSQIHSELLPFIQFTDDHKLKIDTKVFSCCEGTGQCLQYSDKIDQGILTSCRLRPQFSQIKELYKKSGLQEKPVGFWKTFQSKWQKSLINKINDSGQSGNKVGSKAIFLLNSYENTPLLFCLGSQLAWQFKYNICLINQGESDLYKQFNECLRRVENSKYPFAVLYGGASALNDENNMKNLESVVKFCHDFGLDLWVDFKRNRILSNAGAIGRKKELDFVNTLRSKQPASKIEYFQTNYEGFVEIFEL